MSNNSDINTPSYFLSDGKPLIYGDEEDASIRNLSGVNLPEKILFIIDTVRERNSTPFKLSTSGGKCIEPLLMIKRVVESFVCIKSSIQRSHEFALMILNAQGAQWICDFTNNTKSIINQLDLMNEQVLEEDQKSYDFVQLLEKLQSKLPLPTKRNNTVAVPMFVTRVILIYSRSHSIPQFHAHNKYLENLGVNPYFFIDVLYVHEPPCSENLCEEIYAQVTKLDTRNYSYILEVGRNAAKLHDNMAKLLAHPLQRPPQKDACYTICPASSLQEIYTNV